MPVWKSGMHSLGWNWGGGGAFVPNFISVGFDHDATLTTASSLSHSKITFCVRGLRCLTDTQAKSAAVMLGGGGSSFKFGTFTSYSTELVRYEGWGLESSSGSRGAVLFQHSAIPVAGLLRCC